jgi:hypothetical protein
MEAFLLPGVFDWWGCLQLYLRVACSIQRVAFHYLWRNLQLYLRVARGGKLAAFFLPVWEFLFPDTDVNIDERRQGAGRPDVKDDVANGKGRILNH